MTNATPYTQPIVRDLAWLIGSPPIIQASEHGTEWTNSSFWESQLSNATPWLHSLEKNPSALIQLLDKQKDKRLGHRFETLLSVFFKHSERFELLQQNLQIHNQNRTIGEFDFIVYDSHLKATQHWEVACKFYLGIGQTKHLNNWYGPMLKDRLDIKFKQMQTKQSHLSHQPDALSVLKRQGLSVNQRICLMKGRLFHSLTNNKGTLPTRVANDCHTGWWANADDFINHFKNKHMTWAILDKPAWFSLQHVDTLKTHSCNEVVDIVLSNTQPRPQCIAGFSNNTSVEITRGFLVPQHWGSHLLTNE